MLLKDWIEMNEMTQGQFAKELGEPYHKIHYLMRPFSSINLRFAAKIVDFTDGEVDFLDLLEMDGNAKK